ncbi:hypothetical protein ABES02_28075 [Neobacillus pocheonensis]
MENLIKITWEDAVYFMDMVDSTQSPNFVPKMYRSKPYLKILSEKDSNE